MNRISFMSANFVARQLDYRMTDGWMQGDSATQAYFQPLDTFPDRFEALLKEIAALDFTALDLWGAHLNPAWATAAHISAARDLLARYHLTPISFAGWWETLDYFEATCELCAALGIKILGGGGGLIENDRAGMVRLLERYDLRYGLENHPEKTADEILAKIGDPAGGRIGATVDTGWFGTHGTDAAAALRQLAPRVVHVHLKDVLAAGGHVTCAYGAGVVPVEECVRVLEQSGYTGGYSVEHEPEDHDPTGEVSASYALLRGWMAVR